MSALYELGAVDRLAPGIRGPEGVAVDRLGNVYAGGTDGVVRRMSPDGELSEFARAGAGQLGGLAFDRDDNLFVCDGFAGRIVKVTRAGHVSVFAESAGRARLNVPNFPVFDATGDLWVSDSFDRPLAEIDFAAEYRDPRPAGRLLRIEANGHAEIAAEALFMPNGLAIGPDGRWIYILQTTRRNCVRLSLDSPRSHPEPYGPELPGGPDGMAFDANGDLIVTFPAERAVIVLTSRGELRTLAEDPTGETLPFPTNCAFGGEDFRDLYVANMHADYLPRIRLEVPGHPLLNRRQD